MNGTAVSPPAPLGTDPVTTPARDPVALVLKIAGAVETTRTFKQLLKVIAQNTATLCDVDRCSIFLWRDSRLVPSMSQFASGVSQRRLWRAFKHLGPRSMDEIPNFADTLRDRRGITLEHSVGALLPREWIEMFGLRSVMVLPLLQQQRFVGVLVLDNCLRATAIDGGKIEHATAVASQVALAIDNARLLEEVRTTLRETETLLRVGHVIGSTLDLEEVARRITREAAQALGADSAGIYSTENGTLAPLAAYHIPKHLLDPARRARIDLAEFKSLHAFLDRAGPSVWSDDVPNDPLFEHDIFRQFPLRSILMTRLQVREERVGLLVCAWWHKRRRPSPAELRLIEGIGTQAAMAIVNARLYAGAAEAAVNRERLRVDGVIHDTLSQTLFLMGIRLDSCLRWVRGPRLRAKLEDIKRDAALMMAQMRLLLSPEPVAEPLTPTDAAALAMLPEPGDESKTTATAR